MRRRNASLPRPGRAEQNPADAFRGHPQNCKETRMPSAYQMTRTLDHGGHSYTIYPFDRVAER